MATIAVRSYDEDSVKVRVSGMSSGVTTINLYYAKSSSSTNTYVTSISSSSFTKSGSTYYVDYTFTGLASGTTYRFTVNYYKSGTKLDQSTCTATTKAVYTVTVNYYDSGLQASPSSEGSITVRSSGYKSYSGYTFMGWGTSLNSTTVVYSGGETLKAGSSSNKTYNLYALYQKETTVKCWYGDHNNKSYNNRIRYDWKVQRSTSSSMTTSTLDKNLPYFTDSTFTSTSPSGVVWIPLGWRADTTAGSAQIAAGGMPDANYLSTSISAYYAVYSRTVTISYNANGGSGSVSASTGTAYYSSGSGANPASITLKNGASVLTPPTNRTFDHWDLGHADGSGTAYASGSVITTSYDSVMYAIWSAAKPAKWAWTSTIGGELTIKTDSSGAKYVTPLTATEWNNFLARVCEWIDYQNAAYYPTYYNDALATAGTTMTATQASACVKLMTPLNPPVSIPSAPSTNNPITAAFINGLASSLNSLLTA